MNNTSDGEAQAFDALLAASFRLERCEDVTLEELVRLEAALEPADRAALAQLGEDLAARVISGEWSPLTKITSVLDTRCLGPNCSEVTGALHRGDDEGKLTDSAREEMERKLREAENSQNQNRADLGHGG